MNTKWINIMLVACMVSIFSSCEKQESDKFQEDARLYFFRGTQWSEQQDSIRHSFFLIPEGQMRDTVWLDLRTMGFPAESNRPVKVIQTNVGQPGAAVAGVHYVAFDDPALKEAMAVPAHAVSVKIPLIVLHEPSLDNEKVRIEMAVVENDYFKPGIDKNRRFVVTVTAMAEKPGTWDKSWSYYFGAWGTEKMKFIINYLGFSEFEKTDQETGYKNYLTLKGWEKLLEYNAAHPEYPLCEDKGKKHPDDIPCERCVEFP